MSKEDTDLFEEMGEEEAYSPSGYDTDRSYGPDVSIPIWEDASAYGSDTYRLRIQRLNLDGTRSDLGHIAGDASEAALINEWPEAGTYLVMPVDEHNRSLRDQPYRRTIAHDHILLKKKRAEMGQNGTTSSVAAGIDPYIALMREQMAMMQSKMEQMEANYQAKMERVVEREREIEQRALALTVEQNASSAELHQQILQQQQDNFTQVQSLAEQRNQQFMLQLQAMNDARAEADRRQREQDEIRYAQQLERERETRRRDEEERQRSHERMLEKEAARREREIEAMRQQQAYQQQMWEEMAKRREAADQREREREQAFMERQLEASEARKNPIQTVGDLLKPFGYTVADLLPLITGGAKKSVIETIASTAAEVVKASVQSGGLQGLVAQAQGQMEGEEDEQYIPVQVASGQIAMVPRSALAEIGDDEVPPDLAPQIAPQAPQAPQTPTDYIDGSAVFGKPGAGPILPPQPTVIETPVVVAKPNVPLQVAKPARKAIRMLVGDLSGCDQSEWVPKIVQMIADTPESLEYLKIMTVRSALLEAGANQEMTDLIVTSLDDPEYKPFTEGIPRG